MAIILLILLKYNNHSLRIITVEHKQYKIYTKTLNALFLPKKIIHNIIIIFIINKILLILITLYHLKRNLNIHISNQSSKINKIYFSKHIIYIFKID